MMFKPFIRFLLVLLFPVSIGAQECDLVLDGTVRDEDNSEQLSFALIKLISPERIVTTDENGRFQLTGLCAGRYQIMLRHFGCKDSIFTIDLKKSVAFTFRLPHSHNQLKEVEILSKHEEIKFTQATEILDLKSLDRSRGLGLADQLKQLNGVSTFNSGPSIAKPVINGMQGYRVLILNNGVRLEGQQWGSDHAPELDPFLAEKITLVRGASSVRYGSDAIGGIILVEPAPLPDSASLTGSWNTSVYTNGKGAASSLQLQGRFANLPNLSWRAQGSLKKAGTIKTPGYYLQNTGIEEANFSYALEYHIKQAGFRIYYSQFNSLVGIFSGAHANNLTDLQAAFQRNKPLDSLADFSYKIGRAYQNIGHELLKLGTDIHTGSRSRIFVNYALQNNVREEYDKHPPKNDSLAALNLPEAEYHLNTHWGELVWDHDYIRSWRGKFGIQAQLQENRCYQRYFIPNYNSYSVGIFGLEHWVHKKFEWEAGLRYDYKYLQSFFYKGQDLLQPIRNFKNFSFSTGMVYKVSQRTRVNLTLSNAWRAPSVNELYSDGLHHGVGAIERGNDALNVEKSLNAIFNLNFRSKGLRAEANAYTYEFKNYIYYQPSGEPELTVSGAFPVFEYRQNAANISGADANVEFSLFQFCELKLKGMMVRGYNRDMRDGLIYMPADRLQFAISLKARDTKKYKDVFFEPNLLFVAKQTRIQQGVDYAPPPDAYLLLGLNAGCTLNLGKQQLILNFSVTNLSNTVYRDYLDRFRYYNDAVGSNYTLRLRMPFTVFSKNKTA